jgi:hypothetical protein
MTPSDREELKALAEKGYPNWGTAEEWTRLLGLGVGQEYALANGAFLAAASPQTILSLLSDLQAAESLLDQANTDAQDAHTSADTWLAAHKMSEACAQAAKERVGRLEGALRRVRVAIMDPNGPVTDTLWTDEITTAVDEIDLALTPEQGEDHG